jgi:hypothetical protein
VLVLIGCLSLVAPFLELDTAGPCTLPLELSQGETRPALEKRFQFLAGVLLDGRPRPGP